MKKVIFTLLVCLIGSVNAQNWQQVWSDEFNGSISSDWVFETGRGNSGWGNNELQYYRRENATVENGNLVITAKRENFGGANYTSVRMKTQGRKSWKYGRMEARIAMPSFTGVWPAFWMLGDNIGSVGWPKCGEIDVMEHVNTNNTCYGTIHWSDQNGNYANYGGNIGTNVTQFHVYAVEWDESKIQWFRDGQKYHEVNIAGGINGTSEFHNKFFLILNMAIGGNWPGFGVDNNALPARMLVDYVRVFKKSNTPSGDPNLAGTYFLKNRHSNKYMDVADWSTSAGANILQWHYHGGANQKFRFEHVGNGAYKIISVHSGKGLDVANFSTSNGANILQWNAHGGSNQQFIAVPTGNGYYKLVNKNSNKIIETGGWSTTAGANIQQWTDAGQASGQWQLIPVGGGGFEKIIQAENYTNMAGVQLENTTDAGGGQNVGWIDSGDWMAYSGVNIPTSGTYKIEYRVASVGGAQLSSDLNAGSIVLGSVNIPNTNGWQNWTTVSHTVHINAGNYSFGLFAPQGGWNINWIKITSVPAAAQADAMEIIEHEPLETFPNPAIGEVNIVNEAHELDGAQMVISNSQGRVVYEGEFQESIDLLEIPGGIYSVKVITVKGELRTSTFLKQ